MKLRSFHKAGNKCPECASERVFPPGLHTVKFSEVLVTIGVMILAAYLSFQFASFSVWVFRTVTGNPGGGFGFGMFVMVLSFHPACGLVLRPYRWLTGDRDTDEQIDEVSPEDRRLNGFAVFIPYVFILGFFIFATGNRNEIIAMVLFGLVFMLFVIKPLVSRRMRPKTGGNEPNQEDST